MSQAILNTAVSVRQILLHQVQSTPEEIFDIQPEGFNNTIRWNIGHIVVSLDAFLSIGFAFNSNLPKTYEDLFKPGTKPSDWTEAPPSKEELIQYLSAQLETFPNTSLDTLDMSLPSPFEIGPLCFKTVGEVFNFAFIHETMHLSTISCLVKVIQHKDDLSPVK